MRGITPFLWFEQGAEEAVDFYVGLFDDAEITETHRYPEGLHERWPAGEIMTIAFRLQGQDFVALNGGPQYTFTGAISFEVACETQGEVDRLWAALSEGGEEQMCGWLVDRFGITWQIVPTILRDLMNDPDTTRRDRAMAAMLTMRKFDIAALQAAADAAPRSDAEPGKEG